MTQPSDDSLPDDVVDALIVEAFAPLRTWAFAGAVGITSGAVVLLATCLHVLWTPAGGLDLSLLSQYFIGYRVTWWGAVVGALWGGLAGTAAGWLFAAAHNGVLAIWLRVTRARAELVETRDFLDHI